MNPFLRMSTAEKVLALALLAILGVWAVSTLIERVWPFSDARRADRAEAAAETAVKDAAARTLEVEGAQKAAGWVERHYHTREIVSDGLAALDREIANHEDADEPLPADVAADLRAHDRQLCDMGPACAGAAGDAAAPGDPGRRP